MNNKTRSSDLFAEADLPRIFRRSVADIDPENPPEGYQPVLEVTIPGEVSFEDGASEPIFEPAAVGPADCEWDTHRYVDLDAKLMQLLTEPFVGTEPIDLTEHGLVVPAVDPSRRTLIAYFDEMLDDFLEAVDPDDHNERRLARQLATSRLSAHETDGHFQSVIHPKTACLSAIDAWVGIALSTPDFENPPTLAHRFEEVRAIVTEEKAFKQMIDPDHPAHQAVANEIAQHAHSRYQHARGDITDILTFLDEHLSQQEILEILDIACETAVYPEVWLCHMLYDLATDRATDRADFRTNAASFWEVGGDRRKGTYEKSHAIEADFRADLSEHPKVRAQVSTVEVIMIREVGVIRRFLAYDPSPLIGGAIRELLFKREQLAVQSTLASSERLVNNGLSSGGYVTFRFQQENNNPFQRAMAGDISPESLHAAFDVQFDIDAHRKTVQQAMERALERLDFDDINDYKEWLGDEYKER